MKALRFDGTALTVADVPKPSGEDEAIVKVTISGICNTDLEIVRGYAGFAGTIGHEFVGIAESAPGRPDLVGRRVVGEINAGCGACELCQVGDPRHCRARTVLGIVGRDGAHAEYLQLPARNLVPLPDEVSDGSAVFAEPLAAAHGMNERVDVDASSRVAVIGDGKLGLLCAFTMALRTPNVTLIGRHEDKLSHARRRGIECAVASDLRDMAGAFDVVVEASGSESGFASALDLVRPRGTIVLKSTFHGTPTWQASRVVVDEITIAGSRCGRFEPAVELLARADVVVDDLVTDEFPLADGVIAMGRAAEPGVLKVLLRP